MQGLCISATLLIASRKFFMKPRILVESSLYVLIYMTSIKLVTLAALAESVM